MLAFCAAGPVNVLQDEASLQTSGSHAKSTSALAKPVRLEIRGKKGGGGGGGVGPGYGNEGILMTLVDGYKDNKAADEADNTPGKKKKHWWQLV